MNRRGKIALVVLLISTVISFKAYGECNPGYALSRAEWASFGKVKKVFSIAPFTDESKVKTDPWLSMGIAELIGDYLRTAKDIGISKGLISKFPPQTITPNYTVSGSYQKGPASLDIYIKAFKSGDTVNPFYYTSLHLSPPESGLLFTEIGKAVQAMLDSAKINFDKKGMEAAIKATSDYVAFQFYVKGLDAMWKFDANYIDVANTWFQEARKEDVYFERAYLAQEDLYGYLALAAKIEGKPYNHYMEKLEAMESARIKFKDRLSPVAPSKPKVVKVRAPEFTNRILNGNAHYLAGDAAMRGGNYKEAIKELLEAVKFVPEDTMSLQRLYNAYTQLGEASKASEIMAKIGTEGLCQ